MASKFGFGAQTAPTNGWDKASLIFAALKDAGSGLQGGPMGAVQGVQQQLAGRAQYAKQQAATQRLGQLGFGAQGASGGPGGVNIADPSVQSALQEAILAGVPGADKLTALYSAGQPDIKIGPDGKPYNTKDPGALGQRFGNPTNVNNQILDINDPKNLGAYVPDAPVKGALPTMGADGRINGFNLPVSSSNAIAAGEAAGAAGKMLGAAPYTPDDRTNASGAPVYGVVADRFARPGPPGMGPQGAPGASAGGGLVGQSPERRTYGEKTAGSAADRFSAYVNGGQAAQSAIDNATRIDALLGDFEGGKFSTSLTGLASAANSLGFPGIDPKLGNKQAAMALTQQIALGLHSQLPGPMSNADRDYLNSMSPGLAQSASGRKQIIQTQNLVAERAKNISTFAQNWAQKYGGIDQPDSQGRTFENSLRVYAEKNPLFPRRK